MDFDNITNRGFWAHVMPRLGPIGVCDPATEVPEIIESWKISYAQPSHMAEIANLASKLWEPHRAQRLVSQVAQSFHTNADSAWFVITSGPKVAGFAGIRASWMMPEAAECIGINVDPDYQFLGFGRILNRARLALAKELGSSYVLVSTVQPGFFENEGFRLIDVHRGWCVMKKEL